MTEVIIIASLILVTAVVYILFSGTKTNEQKIKSDEIKEEYSKLPCIICGSRLKRGERLKSEKYTVDDKTTVHIFGCPFCLDSDSSKRKCPVCKKSLNSKEFLIGDMWKKDNGKNRLHVKGCVKCISQ
ncbi:MAG TPA: hypothetical protein PK624_01755 [Spirochaetota bacterium]|nr:hypothetical protein [Spirochaetota bacterium]HOF34155.1 hypothetical protein [Spirochaetota bacterium]HOR43502.1 hypothetical protein [Spirochaetota bacterium]HOU83223.1 hypothetical protein [Spirochaetota bacterium]HPK55405.1 hypothetical protein [Spirochaetota bacterium]